MPASRSDTPPGPGGGPLGQFREMTADMPGLLLRVARDYGTIARLRFGPISMYLVTDPELVHRMLVRQQASFHKSRRTSKLIGGHLGNGLLTLEGAEHRRHRRLILPSLHTQRIAGYGELMVAEAQRLDDSWPDGHEVELADEMAELTLRIVSAALFSVDAPEMISTVHDFAASLNRGLRGAALLPGWLPTTAQRMRRAVVPRMDALAFDLIRSRRAAGSDRGDLLSMLISAQDAEGGPQLTDAEIRDELMTMFFAGHETSASALVWAFHLLSAHPQVASAVRQELATTLAGAPATMADLARLPMLTQAVKEILRMYPPGWLFDRTPVEDVELGEYVLPKGSIVLFSPWVMHRDPAYWESPDEFRPARFALEDQVPKIAYVPFGDGPRMCVGNRFAEAEIALVLATMLPRVELTRVSDEPVVPSGDATIRPKGGLRMRVSRNLAI